MAKDRKKYFVEYYKKNKAYADEKSKEWMRTHKEQNRIWCKRYRERKKKEREQNGVTNNDKANVSGSNFTDLKHETK